LALPFIWLLSLAITKPIHQLIEENNKIQRRAYKDVVRIPTMIKELDDLSGSMLSMSSSIQNYQQSQADLLNSIIRLIADAIDAKSPYTGGHCQRVPLLAMMLVDEANKDNGTFSAFKFDDEDERRAFEIGAWLHDCGKVTTPEYVVDKATKLETIYNRIHEIRTRFEVLWRDADIAYYQAIINGENKESAQNKRIELQQSLQDDFSFIASTNAGGEYLSEDKIERIRAIGEKTWLRHFDAGIGLSQEELERAGNVNEDLPVIETLLADKASHKIAREHFDFEKYRAQGFKEPVPELLYDQGELLNLTISKGTLTNEERFKIKEHIIMTIKMLENVPFPEEYKNVPRYAGTHHETLKGTGYPRQLTADDLSIPEKIMVIADIFEALTASDRPYKEAKTLSQSIKIMSFMVKDEHIDAELFNLFLQSGTYLKYAEQFLKPEQIDEVDLSAYL
jgi:HD-GYP domain-containing protein (c-di-GMP phosphodiesterase class II)